MSITWTFSLPDVDLPDHDLDQLRDEFEALIGQRLRLEERELRRVVEREGF